MSQVSVSNGNVAVSVKWLVAVMGAIIGTGTLLYINSLAATQRDNADRVQRLEERQSRLEVDFSGMRADLAYIRTTLLRIEAKLER